MPKSIYLSGIIEKVLYRRSKERKRGREFTKKRERGFIVLCTRSRLRLLLTYFDLKSSLPRGLSSPLEYKNMWCRLLRITTCDVLKIQWDTEISQLWRPLCYYGPTITQVRGDLDIFACLRTSNMVGTNWLN